MILSKLFITILLFLASVGAFAEKVTVNTTPYKPGGTVDVSISLENTGAVSGYTMKLCLPDGFTMVYDENNGGYVCELSDRHGMEYAMTQMKASDGGYLFVVYPNKSGDVIMGNSGLLFTTKLSVASTVTGSQQAIIKSIAVSDTDGKEKVLNDVFIDLIKASPITVTATNYSRQYGESNPTFDYKIKGGKLEGTPSVICKATETSPVGTYDIVVAEGGVTSQNVTYVNGTLTVTRAPLTITAKSYTIKQGENLPIFEAEYMGFKNNESAEVLTKKPTLETTATSTNVPGTYDILVSGVEAENYEPSYVKGTLTISQADPVSVIAKSYSRVYGAENPIFEYTVTGAALEGKPEISCEATATSPVGEYPIIIKKGSVTNYNDSYVAGTLTITKAPLKISAGTYTRKQGEENPEFTLTYEGFKNGETEAVLTKQPTVTCEATATSTPGEYEVNVKGAEAENYEISYVPGTLTVTGADDGIIAGDINGNDEVDDEDVDAFIELYLDDEIPEPGDADFGRFDANGDGIISLADAVAIFYLSNGLNYDGTDPNAARAERQ